MSKYPSNPAAGQQFGRPQDPGGLMGHQGGQQFGRPQDSGGLMGHQQAQGLEVPFLVNNQQKWISGIMEDTTCADIIRALLAAEGKLRSPNGGTTSGMAAAEPANDLDKFVLVERWRKVERPLRPESYLLKIWRAWGSEAQDVQFILKRVSSRRSSGVCMTRRPVKLRRSNSKLMKQLAQLESKHPSYMTDSDSEISTVQDNIQSLLRIIIAQRETIQSQLKNLKAKDMYLKTLDRTLSCTDGREYVLRNYLEQIPEHSEETLEESQDSGCGSGNDTQDSCNETSTPLSLAHDEVFERVGDPAGGLPPQEVLQQHPKGSNTNGGVNKKLPPPTPPKPSLKKIRETADLANFPAKLDAGHVATTCGKEARAGKPSESSFAQMAAITEDDILPHLSVPEAAAAMRTANSCSSSSSNTLFSLEFNHRMQLLEKFYGKLFNLNRQLELQEEDIFRLTLQLETLLTSNPDQKINSDQESILHKELQHAQDELDGMAKLNTRLGYEIKRNEAALANMINSYEGRRQFAKRLEEEEEEPASKSTGQTGSSAANLARADVSHRLNRILEEAEASWSHQDPHHHEEVVGNGHHQKSSLDGSERGAGVSSGSISPPEGFRNPSSSLSNGDGRTNSLRKKKSTANSKNNNQQQQHCQTACEQGATDNSGQQWPESDSVVGAILLPGATYDRVAMSVTKSSSLVRSRSSSQPRSKVDGDSEIACRPRTSATPASFGQDSNGNVQGMLTASYMGARQSQQLQHGMTMGQNGLAAEAQHTFDQNHGLRRFRYQDRNPLPPNYPTASPMGPYSATTSSSMDNLSSTLASMPLTSPCPLSSSSSFTSLPVMSSSNVSNTSSPSIVSSLSSTSSLSRTTASHTTEKSVRFSDRDLILATPPPFPSEEEDEDLDPDEQEDDYDEGKDMDEEDDEDDDEAMSMSLSNGSSHSAILSPVLPRRQAYMSPGPGYDSRTGPGQGYYQPPRGEFGGNHHQWRPNGPATSAKVSGAHNVYGGSLPRGVRLQRNETVAPQDREANSHGAQDQTMTSSSSKPPSGVKSILKSQSSQSHHSEGGRLSRVNTADGQQGAAAAAAERHQQQHNNIPDVASFILDADDGTLV